VMRGLARDPSARFATAEEMADALEDAIPPMPSRKLAAWVRSLLGDKLSLRAKLVREIESASTGGKPEVPSTTLASAQAAPLIDSMDVTIAVESVEEPSAQGSSQASSISVETPRRPSVVPFRSRRTPKIVGGGVALLIGTVAVVAAVHGLGSGKSGATLASEAVPTSTFTAPPVACAMPSPPPAAPPADTLIAPPPVWPAESLPIATATPTATPTATTPPSPPRPSSRPSTPPAQRPAQPAPQPSAKLYSRF